MISDYYFVRKGYLIIQDLYRAGKHTTYIYTYGFHWRGYTAYICGILINIVGFVGAIGRPVPKGATYVYNLNFFCGFIVSSGTYYLLCRFFPIPGCSDTWCEVGDEIRNVSVAYGADERFDDSGSDRGYTGKDVERGVHVEDKKME